MAGEPVDLARLRSEVAELVGEAGSVTWLVGGVVRDALLERPLLDVDLVTAADPEQVARRIARGTGATAFRLGDDPPCWRVAVRTDPELGSATIQYDVCALRGETLQQDLAARDFAANALALPLDPRHGGIVDDHGGLEDVRRGRLRMVDERAFDDDPLRMLRAARLVHLLGWELDAPTASAIRARAHRAGEPAGERTATELHLLLLHAEARRGWRRLEELGIDRVLLPELDACRGMAQSRFHHLDVHDHTLAVLDNCEDLLAATDFWLPLPVEPGLTRAPWTQDQRLVVLLAALCHDLGKPATRGTRPGGGVSFVGHDAVGMDIVDGIAARLRWSGSVRQRVRRLVGTHLALGFLLHTERGPRERWRLRRELSPVVPEAVVLSVGDRMATAGPEDRRRWLRAHLELARQVWTDHWRAVRDGEPAPLLDGRAIAEAAGIEPGPGIGELVEALAQAQAVGEVSTREQALTLVRERARRTPG